MARSSYRFLVSVVFAAFISNTLAPTLQFTFADSTTYYVSASGGSDAADGLSPATAWQTLGHVNSQIFLQGDIISLQCGDIWAEGLSAFESGNIGLPITVNSYGTCDGSNNPLIQSADVSGASYITINGLTINTLTGSTVTMNGSANIAITNSSLSSADSTVISISGGDGISVTNNSFSSGTTAIAVTNASTTIQGNTFSNLSNDAIILDSPLGNTIANNSFSGLLQSAIVFSQNTNILQNALQNICTTGGTTCAAIKNNTSLPSGTSLSGSITENIIQTVGAGVIGGNNGIAIKNATNVNIAYNTINDAEDTISLVDAANISTSNNTLLFARKNSLAVVQNNAGIVTGNTLAGNTFLQRNVDYPYIEMRDEVPGTGTASLISANGNNFVTMYKPDTSYVRSVKFGGETVEYTKKKDLDLFDVANTKFQSFGYMPYVSTGSYATANLLTNPSFETDVTGWTTSSATGTPASLSQNVAGSYSGASMVVTPQNASPDRMWITNDAILSIVSGRVYEVTGYLRSTSTGDLNIRTFLHKAGDMTTIYSDRIAETYSTATGRTFQFYIYTNTTVADAQLSFETSNPDIAFEMDEVSLRRKTMVMKNTDPYEVFTFSNTGSVAYSQDAPVGSPDTQYVDTTNASITWPISVPAHSTNIVLWNNSSNELSPPLITFNIDSGSVPLGTDAHISWNVVDSDRNTLQYTTSTGTFTTIVSNSGDLYFKPPAGLATTEYLSAENEIGMDIKSAGVSTTNTAPIFYPVTISGNEDDIFIIGTLSGVDLNPGDTVFFSKVQPDPNYGTAIVSLSGTATYFPNSDFCGTDTFYYDGYDNNYPENTPRGDATTATVNVTCVNDVPTAINDSYIVTGSMMNMNVLSNDTDIDTLYQVQTFSLSGFSQPANGSVVMNGTTFDYTPNIGYIGSDSFTYSMEDQSGALSNTGIINIIVDTSPMGSDTSYIINEDQILNDTLSGSDANGDTLTFTVSTLPTNGTVVLGAGGAFTYTPNANYYGTDSFTYQVYDGYVYSPGALVDITLSSVPDAPVALADSYSVTQDVALLLPVMNNDTDMDSTPDALVLTGYTNPSNGTISISGTGFLYTPNAGYSGNDSFSYQVMDETSLLSNTVTVSLNIIAVNTAPAVSDDAFSLNEDSMSIHTLSGSDPEGATLTYQIDALPANGTVILSSTGLFTYTLNVDYYGTDSFTVHANDGLADSNIATITLTVNSINDAPIALSGTYLVAGNSYVSNGNIFIGSLSGADIDSSFLTFSASTLPTHGLLTLTNTGYLTYTPAYGYLGADSFTFTIQDEQGGISNTGIINLNITGINTAPIAQSGTYITNEDTALSLTLSGSDPDNNPITYVLDSGVASGTLTFAASGSVVYVPSLNQNGTVSFSYHVNDGQASSPIVSVTIDVLPVNDAPIATAASYTVIPNALGSSGSVLTATGVATDAENNPMTFSIVSSPAHGTVVMNSSGGFTYTPDGGYLGTDSFTFAATDGILQSIPAQITLSVGTPAVAISGPGGGGGGSASAGSSSSSSDSFSSAPVAVQGFVATSDLSSQLLFTRRTASGEIIPVQLSTSTGIFQNSIIDSSILGTHTADDVPVLLRKIARNVISSARNSNNPLYEYQNALNQIQVFDTKGDFRLTLTKDYVLRILQFHQKKYEEMIYRDLNSAAKTDSSELDSIVQ